MKALKIFLSICMAALFALMGGIVIGNVFDISPLYGSSAFFMASFIPTNKGVTAINIFMAPGGIGTPFAFQMNYLPEFISFTNVVPLTSLRIETAEDGVLHDFTAAGMVAMSGYMNAGALPANILQLRLSDGELRPKNVTISGVTSAAGAVPFFISSHSYGRLPLRSKNGTVLANNPTTFEKFTALFIPTLATVTDRVEVTYNNGYQQTFNMEDLRNLSAIYQQVPGVIVNNLDATIQKVIVTTAAQTPVYILSAAIPNQG